VLAPDQRGYSPGARSHRRRDYALGVLAGDVLALADQAGAQRFDLVGHDWGALLGWWVAGHHPDRVRSLTALAVPHPGAIREAWTRSAQALRSYYILVFQLPGLPERIVGFRRGALLRRNLIASGLDPESADRFSRRDDWTGPINWYRGIPFSGPAGRMPRIGVPTLFIRGDRDKFVSRTAAERCARWVAGPYTYRVLPGVSHWIAEREPARTAALILELLASRPA